MGLNCKRRNILLLLSREKQCLKRFHCICKSMPFHPSFTADLQRTYITLINVKQSTVKCSDTLGNNLKYMIRKRRGWGGVDNKLHPKSQITLSLSLSLSLSHTHTHTYARARTHTHIHRPPPTQSDIHPHTLSDTHPYT